MNERRLDAARGVVEDAPAGPPDAPARIGRLPAHAPARAGPTPRAGDAGHRTAAAARVPGAHAVPDSPGGRPPPRASGGVRAAAGMPAPP